MPTPTDVLDSAIHDLERKVDSNQAEVLRRLEKLDDNHLDLVRRLERLDAKFDGFSGLSKWGVNLAFPIVVAILGSAIAAAWYAARLDNRVSQLEQVKATPAK